MPFDINNIREKITEIIILSLYEIEDGSKKRSAQEMLDFKKRAFDAYRGLTLNDCSLNVNMFYARVSTMVALIMKAIQEEIYAI